MLESGNLRDRHLKWKQYGKRASLSDDTTDLDAAVMIFDNTVRKRKTKTGTIALGGVERTKNVGQVLRRNASTSIADHNAGVAIPRTDFNVHRARLLHGLHRVEEQIQKNLVYLIAVMFNFRQIGCLLQFDLDWS